MRFSLLIITVAMLPLLMIAHGWIYTEKQMPGLREQALKILQSHRIRSAGVDVRYLDLRITGDAPDLESLEKARAAVSALGPLRLVADDLSIPASLRVDLVDQDLLLEGWLPEGAGLHEITQVLSKLRPDLKLKTDRLVTRPEVRWPDGEKGPLTRESSLLGPVLEKLRVMPWLEIVQEPDGLRITGILPANGLKSDLLAALNLQAEPALLESTHTQPALFAQPQALLPFVKRFFSAASPRRFSIRGQGEPMIEAPATRGLESEWLDLLRAVTGGKKVVSHLTFYPSEFHFPHYQPTSPLADGELEPLKKVLAGELFSFGPGSVTLNAEQQVRLAALTPILLKAGPALKLLIGGHPNPEGTPENEKRLAKARASAVYSYLVEQGLPTIDVQMAVFEVTANTLATPAQQGAVEILIR